MKCSYRNRIEVAKIITGSEENRRKKSNSKQKAMNGTNSACTNMKIMTWNKNIDDVENQMNLQL